VSQKEPRRLSPYEQLRLEAHGEQSVAVHTPWLSLECELQGSSTSPLKAILSSLYRYPICYIHPRKLSWRDTRSVLSSLLGIGSLNLQPSALAKKVSPSNSRVLDALENKRFTWDCDEVIRFSRSGVPRVSDTLAAFSVLRRNIHESLLQTTEKNFIQKLEHYKSRPELFRRGVALLVLQNYHVTSNCRDALKIAVNRLPSVSLKASAYVESESGHDKLVLKSLNLLGYMPSEKIVVFPETELLVDILKFSCARSILSFASMIEFFEAGSSTKRHPLANLLEGTPWAGAAEPLQMHRNINVDGGHSSAALSFLFEPEYASVFAVCEAVRLVELAVLVRSLLLERLKAELELLAASSG